MVEAWGLTQAAMHLKNGLESNDVDQMRAAARLNWRLWTIFQADLLSHECTVPTEIRGNVLSLADFVDKRTVEFLANPQAEKLQVLININRELAMGMYDSVDNESKKTPADEKEGKAVDEGDDKSMKLSI
ncbi:MAG: flagellar biosynthesis regulator FlaF [Rhodospirillales bacterium]|nr:flagellar biosynthesis regulator FlaF [Rhodospirillales bacterium]MCW8952912.1 flagellar biosynthesis regulator FlaF [Rhodospirillales bacterium]MCW8970262.1 flagellar biosynthesis regulator FlaF [Rhodospirillales bacterium]MCW9002562.1 flagellar biosynthesis regulator FlaF [Rhodospirillales bacterium]MCW9039921.1 flagellar biosynthesis regulator FlaF [Rhodospirillales bacterium]